MISGGGSHWILDGQILDLLMLHTAMPNWYPYTITTIEIKVFWVVKKYLKSAVTLFLFKLISIGPCFGLSSEVLRIHVSQEIAKLPEVKVEGPKKFLMHGMSLNSSRILNGMI